MPAPICALPEQQEIVRLLDEQFTVIAQNEREIDAALKRSEAPRQSILKKAFSGQLVPQRSHQRSRQRSRQRVPRPNPRRTQSRHLQSQAETQPDIDCY